MDLSATTNRDALSLNSSLYYANKVGDICQYISATTNDPAIKGTNYRMPKSSEFGPAGDYNWGTGSGLSESIGWYKGRKDDGRYADFVSPTFTILANGQSVFDGASQCGFVTYQGAIFSAGGLRYNDGFMGFVGQYGSFWSCSANGTTGAYDLGYRSGYVRPSDASNRRTGCHVRCVKI
jgi:hypothetical protein